MDLLCNSLQGGPDAAVQMIMEILRNTLANQVPPELVGMVTGLAGTMISSNLNRCREIYLE